MPFYLAVLGHFRGKLLKQSYKLPDSNSLKRILNAMSEPTPNSSQTFMNENCVKFTCPTHHIQLNTIFIQITIQIINIVHNKRLKVRFHPRNIMIYWFSLNIQINSN